MATTRQSWSAVEDKLLTDIAKWISKVSHIPRRLEELALVEGASVMPLGNGVVGMRVGMLEWELTPPSNYKGYCKMEDDWLLVSGSEFRVAVRSPYGTRSLQVCPRNAEVDLLGSQALLPMSMQNLRLLEGSLSMNSSMSNLNVDDKLSSSLLACLFDTRETTVCSSRRKAEIIGENFSRPFLRCVSDVQTAKNISDVLETILELSAAYDSTQGALQQGRQVSFDLTGSFYNDQVWEKDSRKNSSLWVRQQVNHAAMKCQTAAATTTVVAEIGARILVDLYINPFEVAYAFQFKREDGLNIEVVENVGDSEMGECSDEVNPISTASLPCDQDGLMNGSSSISTDPRLSTTPQHCNSGYFGSGANLDNLLLEPVDSRNCDQLGIGNLSDCNHPTRSFLRTDSFSSSWQSNVGNDTCSESSWEVVRSAKHESNVEDGADVLGAEFSDAESLDVMLRDLDPFGKRDCSPLINELINLNMNSATCSADDSDEEHSTYVKEYRETKVLQRLASWSSSNSGSWTDDDIYSSAPPGKNTPTAPLETLAEEPACAPQISRLYRSFVFRAAAEGNVLQWCSCKFNKLRCSIELKFQVGNFMEHDIATLSTGISLESPLHVEIFLDSTNVRESLLKGDVRVSAHQGVVSAHLESWKNAGDRTTALPPVAGLSCYIPHLVRQYLKQEAHAKRSSSGYEFPDGELVTGLMQYVVAQLVFIKHTCCVCNHETPSDLLTSTIPLPCGKNLCQALYNAWLVVAPPVVLELPTVVDWLKACFDEDPLYKAFIRHCMIHQNAWTGTYEEKIERVAKWLNSGTFVGSWLKIAVNKSKLDEMFESEASEEAQTGTASPLLSVWTRGDSMTQATKRRKTGQSHRDDDEPSDSRPLTVSPSRLFPIWDDDEGHEDLWPGPGEHIGNFDMDDFSAITSTPRTMKESDVFIPRPLSLSKAKGESSFSPTRSPSGTSPRGHGRHLSSSLRRDFFVEPLASARPPKRSPAQAQGESSAQGDQDWGLKNIPEDLQPVTLEEKLVASTRPPE